jgi:hypothetical protein
MVRNKHNSQILNQIFWLGIFGLAIYGLGLLGYIKLYSVLPLIIFLLYQIRPSIPRISIFEKKEKLMVGLIVCQLFVYSLGLFVPETAFDSIWYHFPEARMYAKTGQITPLPEILYSTMPRLGEMYFTVGFLLAGQFGAKLFSFIFTLFLLGVSFLLARKFLSRPTSLLVVATINSMFVIAWQSTAGYVDIMAAVFQLAAVLAIISSSLPLAAVFTGFALSVKMQSVIHLIALIPLVFLYAKKSLSQTLLFLLLSFAAASPWYIFNYRSTGSAFYPLNLPTKQRDQLQHAGEYKTKKDWVINQMINLPKLPIYVSLQKDFQFTPIILFLLPALFFMTPRTRLGIYPTIFLLLWWFTPPPEHRYALAAIPPLAVILFSSLGRFRRPAIAISLIVILLNLSARVYISRRYLPVIIGSQTKAAYIESQTTDFNRDIMEKFYIDE